MARIIPLKRDAEPSSDVSLGPQGCVGEPAQIILFPGVRYERWQDNHKNAASGGCTTRDHAPKPRDWLDV